MGFSNHARLKSNEKKTAGVFSPSTEVQVRCDDGAVRGRPGPCSGELEFASHTGAGSRAGVTDRQNLHFELDTPRAGRGPGDLLLRCQWS